MLITGCNEAPKKEIPATVVEKEVVIPDALLGKDLEGNEILVGKISYAQMASTVKRGLLPTMIAIKSCDLVGRNYSLIEG